jgi:invasion protein IalB
VIASFNITGNSAVNAVAADTVSYSADNAAVIVTTAAPLAVTIYNAAGLEVANTTVAAGTTRFPLPQGVYVVNGTKLIIG